VVVIDCDRSNLVDVIGCENPAQNSVNEVGTADLLELLAAWGDCPE
jgi:hypothetical protein